MTTMSPQIVPLFGIPEGPGWLLLLLVVVVVFGAKKLPEIARGSGQALKIFKEETQGLVDDKHKPQVTEHAETTGGATAVTAATAATATPPASETAVPASTVPASAVPASTAPASTVPVNAAPVNAAPINAAPVSSAPAEAEPVYDAEIVEEQVATHVDAVSLADQPPVFVDTVQPTSSAQPTPSAQTTHATTPAYDRSVPADAPKFAPVQPGAYIPADGRTPGSGDSARADER